MPEKKAENKNKLSDKFKEAETDKDKLTIKAESQELESSISKNKKLLERTEKNTRSGVERWVGFKSAVQI